MADIPFDDRDGFIWLDGEMVPWREAKIHILTHSLHYGSAVFEGIRIYNGKIFKLIEHTERLLGSCNVVDIDCPFSAEEINEACIQAAKVNNIENGYIRPIIWRGSQEMGIGAKTNKIHCAVASWEWDNFFGEKFKNEGIKIITSSWTRPSPDSVPCHAKASGLYITGTLAKHAADRAGYHDALMLDYRGYVAEVTACNFFIVKDGVIHTPTADCFLNGITRQTVIELARQEGYEVEERHITPDEVKSADECFVTGTAVEVLPVSLIDKQEYPIGPITTKIMQKYEELVRS